jgi:phospholipid/cholesterol/gamma-HCH transport system substrate-binding protein
MRSSPLTVLADQGMLIMGRVDEATRRINELLGTENQQRFSAALGDIAGAAKGVNELTHSLNRTITERIDPAAAQLPELSENARRSMLALEKAGQEAGQLATEVRQLAQRCRTGWADGPAGARRRVHGRPSSCPAPPAGRDPGGQRCLRCARHGRRPRASPTTPSP